MDKEERELAIVEGRLSHVTSMLEWLDIMVMSNEGIINGSSSYAEGLSALARLNLLYEMRESLRGSRKYFEETIERMKRDE